MRKDPLTNDHFYHIFSRSIAGFKIFNEEDDYFRIIEALKFYQYKKFNIKYSRIESLSVVKRSELYSNLKEESSSLVQIVAYCIMPTHLHLLLKQVTEGGISDFIRKVLDSYSRYYNSKVKRKGPLWEGRFNSVLVGSDEQLLHLTRYIHLNPSSAGLVKNPADWQYSSYREYVKFRRSKEDIARFGEVIDLLPNQYKEFIDDRISYQRELSKIKKLLIEDYSG